MRKHNWIILLAGMLQVSCSSGEQSQNFTFKETSQGVEVLEDENPVFFFQLKSKSNQENSIFNNYIHPLYSLSGDTLTEEFPEDHPHHRGIFWAWHQIYIADNSVGDGWTRTNINQQISKVTTDKAGKLIVNSLWKSPLFDDNKAFLSEETKITVSTNKSYRIIDFRISLTALVPEVEIGGSADAKGYGGFSARITHQEQIIFNSPKGKITPQNLQVDAGPWMDFIGPLGAKGATEGLAILCHPQTPNYPAPWILRSEPSMQNIVYPGNSRVIVPMNKPLSLYYRIIIHDENVSSSDINTLQLEYENENY